MVSGINGRVPVSLAPAVPPKTRQANTNYLRRFQELTYVSNRKIRHEAQIPNDATKQQIMMLFCNGALQTATCVKPC